MENLRVGVIGVGRMGQRHCRVYSTMRKVQLSGVCDVDPERGKSVAAQYEVPNFQDVDELLGQIDAVSLAIPTQQHFELVMKCIARGVHVLVEKPIAESLEQAEQLALTAESEGLVVQVGHIERFNPVYMELKNILEDLPPLAVNIQRLSPYQGSNVDVDVVLDLMIHDTNLILDLLGRYPEYLDAVGLTAYSGTIDHAMVQVCYPNGPIVSMTASRVTEHKVRRIDVTCREAYVECDLLNKSISIHRATIGEYINANKRGVKYRQESLVERINIPTFEPLFLQLQHFVECVIEKKRPAVSARDGYEALKLAMEIRAAILARIVNMDRRKTPRSAGATRRPDRIPWAVK